MSRQERKLTTIFDDDMDFEACSVEDYRSRGVERKQTVYLSLAIVRMEFAFGPPSCLRQPQRL